VCLALLSTVKHPANYHDTYDSTLLFSLFLIIYDYPSDLSFSLNTKTSMSIAAMLEAVPEEFSLRNLISACD
jgi:hypothetical protein